MLELILVIHDDFINVPLKYLAKKKSADFCFFPRIKNLKKNVTSFLRLRKDNFSKQHKCLDL